MSPSEKRGRGQPSPAGAVDAVALAGQLERVASLVRRLSPTPDISMTTASTMRALERDGPGRLSDLATREGVTQPAMTQLVTRLERDGYAERRGDPSDARVVLVHLTPLGGQVLRHRRAWRAERLAGLLAQLPPRDVESIAAAMPALERLTNMNQPTPISGDRR